MNINIMKKKTIHINPQTLSRIFVKDKRMNINIMKKKTIHNQCLTFVYIIGKKTIYNQC